MPSRFRQSFRFHRGYWPSQPLVGEANDTIYRGKNMIVRGGAGEVYTEAFRGAQDVSSLLAYGVSDTLAGMAGMTSGVATIAGGFPVPVFSTTTRVGDVLLINNRLFVITRIETDNTCRIAPTPDFTGSFPILRPRQIQDVDAQIGSLISGNFLRLPRGHLLVVGRGTVYLGTSSTGIVATPGPKLAIFDPSLGSYTGYALGAMADMSATALTVTATGGGTKNMPAGTYSVRISRARSATNGYENPSLPGTVTIADNERVRVTFPAMDTGDGQDAWAVFVSLYAVEQDRTGPWYLLDILTTSDVPAGGGTYDFEWLSEETAGADLATFDNDSPAPGAFIALLGGIPIVISSRGTPPDISVLPTTESPPGPVIQPAKPNNIEAFPAISNVAVGPPESIIGYVEGQGRLYLMTRNRLHIVSLTGLEELPVTVRPFWRTGFVRHQSLTFVNGVLYGFTSRGPTRSAADGEEGAEEYEFAAPVAVEMESWARERVVVAHDPYNEAVCFFHANDSTNASGFQTTKVLMYMLRLGIWSPPIIIESTSAHMVVASAAAVNGRLYFVANEKVWLYDAGTNSVSWYVATPFTDQGAEGIDKTITGLAATVCGTAVTAGIHANTSNQAIPVTDLETGNGASESGSIALGSPSSMLTTAWKKLNVRDKRLYALRVDGTFSGSGNKDRVDEVVVEGYSSFPRH